MGTADLRKRYRDVLGRGKFVDEEPLVNGNAVVKCKAFETENRLAVVLWNPTTQPQTIKLGVPGRKLLEIGTVVGKLDKPELPATIAPQQVLVAVYEK